MTPAQRQERYRLYKGRERRRLEKSLSEFNEVFSLLQSHADRLADEETFERVISFPLPWEDYYIYP